MHRKLVFPAILAVALSVACSKPETTVQTAETDQPSTVTSQEATETAEPAETQTSTSEEVTTTAPPEPTATTQTTQPAAPTPRPSTPTTTPTTPVQPVPEPTETAAPEPATPAVEPPTASVPPEAETEEPATRASSGKAPKTHTVDHGGIMHAPGEETATKKCAACHGPELKGGKIAKISCFECHEKNWN
jgi:hypothetical protein